MKKLNVESLAVESFAVGSIDPLTPISILQCTGCVSGCGIVGSDLTRF